MIKIAHFNMLCNSFIVRSIWNFGGKSISSVQFIRIVILASMEGVCFRALPFPSIFLPHHIPHLSTNPDVFLRHKFELAR